MTTFRAILDAHLDAAEASRRISADIERAADLVCETLRRGAKVLLCGNGGSAADCQHIATELTIRFEKNRRALPAIALTTDTSALTAAVNDFGADQMFSRQVAALGRAGDVLIAISTSGNSSNVISAIKEAKATGISVIALSGRDGGKMKSIADLAVIVPSNVTARIQEMHILIGHYICGRVEAEY